jgi:hypothetical protein
VAQVAIQEKEECGDLLQLVSIMLDYL